MHAYLQASDCLPGARLKLLIFIESSLGGAVQHLGQISQGSLFVKLLVSQSIC
jgi:hypothetical protein